MTRPALVIIALAALVMTPGCIVIQTADLAVGATGAVVGTAGKVVGGAVDIVTPGKSAAQLSEDVSADGADASERANPPKKH